MVRCRYSSEFTWTICHETMALRLPYAQNHKMQNLHSVYITCIFHFFSCSLSMYFFFHNSFDRVYASKMIWVNRKSPIVECFSSYIYKDAIDPYFSTRFFYSVVFIRFVTLAASPNNGITYKFSTIFSNSMFDLFFFSLQFLMLFLLFNPSYSHATRVCVS